MSISKLTKPVPDHVKKEAVHLGYVDTSLQISSQKKETSAEDEFADTEKSAGDLPAKISNLHVQTQQNMIE